MKTERFKKQLLKLLSSDSVEIINWKSFNDLKSKTEEVNILFKIND